MSLRVILVASASLLLAACGPKYDVLSVRSIPNMGSEFHRALQAEYADLAAAEKAEADWNDTRLFIERARRAAEGTTFPPEAISSRTLPNFSLAALSAARIQLVTALTDYAIKNLPLVAADAQSNFDCWIQEQEENRQPADIAACRSAFQAALRVLDDALEILPASATPDTPATKASLSIPAKLRIFFGFDSANLDPQAMKIVELASRTHEKYNSRKLLLVGHADSAGPKNYNLPLSRRRAESAYAALAAKGVPRNEMRVEAYGEERLEIGAPDGTREARNRRVEVIFGE